MKKYVNFDVVKLVLCGSPGFLKDDFYVYMENIATRQGDSAFLKQKSKFLRGHASSGHKKAIDEMLGNPDIQSQMEDIKATKEVYALQRFHKMMSDDEDRAVYGFKETLSADEHLAIDELLVTDKVFLGEREDIVASKSSEKEKAAQGHGQGIFKQRTQYVELAERVKERGGKVHIFSSMHVSGQQLDKYTGCAAILRFPLPEVADVSDGASSDEDSD